MSMRYAHTFQSFDRFAAAFAHRTSSEGAVLPANRQPAAGSEIELDLRLPNGTPLLVGKGRVEGPSDDPPGVSIRFLSITAESRVTIARLAALLAEQPPADLDTPSPRPATGASGPLADLVARTYGDGQDDDEPGTAILVPPPDAAVPPAPEPAAPALAAAAAPPASRPTATRRAAAEAPRVRATLGAGTIAAVVVALVLGGALHAYFDEIAALFGLTSNEAFALEPRVDALPDDIAPSDFSNDRPAAPTADGARVVPIEPLPTDPQTDGTTAAEEELEPLPPLDRIRLIHWDEAPSGTIVTLWANGSFLPERVLHSRLPGERPREVIKLRGVDLPYRDLVLTPETGELERIRTGFHPQNAVNELHVVLDLAGPDVRLEKMEQRGSALRLHLVDGVAETAESETTSAGR